MRQHLVALSGGKDSTAMALRLRELNPDVPYRFFCTPTGDELPDMVEHWENLERLLQAQLERLPGITLAGLVQEFKALPSHRARWCTRMLKIQPALALIHSCEEMPVMYVGLRADEEERQGIYSDQVDTRFPMREWGWTIEDVKHYLSERGVSVPRRTDCARCYAQRLSEWYDLWRDYPEVYADAEREEAWVSEERGRQHSYRNPDRDGWPGPLAELRLEFERGRLPRGTRNQLGLWPEYDDGGACRVCRL